MKIFNLIVATICFVVATSCTLDKTDFESEINQDVTEYFEFKEVIAFNSGAYKVSVEALNGVFYKGYNEVHLKILNTRTNQLVKNSNVTFLPILTNSENLKSSCPHQYNLKFEVEQNYYSGYVVFTSISNPMEQWNLHINFEDEINLYLLMKVFLFKIKLIKI